MQQAQIKGRTSEFYDYVWTKYLPEIEEHNRWLKTLISEDEIRDKTVLDAGCGTGIGAIGFKMLGAKKVTGIDFSQGALNTAKSLAQGLNLDITFKQCDLLKLDLGQESFDIIYSFGVLHHTGNTRLAFENLMGHLKPGGQFILALYLKTPFTFIHQGLRKFALVLPNSARKPLSRLASLAMIGKKKVKRGFDGEGDALDWLFVPHRDHYTPEEIGVWFKEHKMEMRLLVPYTGRFKSTSNFIVKGFQTSLSTSQT